MPMTSRCFANLTAVILGYITLSAPGGAAVAAGASPRVSAAASGVSIRSPAEDQSYHRWHDMAERLYVATSRDAQTFQAALLIPEVRRKIEKVLGPLSDLKLKQLAAQSNAEAIYWYEYIQGMEHQ
jgi:hypothetical protein